MIPHLYLRKNVILNPDSLGWEISAHKYMFHFSSLKTQNSLPANLLFRKIQEKHC